MTDSHYRLLMAFYRILSWDDPATLGPYAQAQAQAAIRESKGDR